MSKINLWRLVSDHLRTLVDYPNTRLSAWDAALFMGLPILAGMASAWFHLDFKADVLNGLLTAFSIFAGLLLNLLILVFSFTQSSSEPSNPMDNQAIVRWRVVREIHANISFAILVSLAMVVATMVSLWMVKHAETTKPVETNSVLTFLLVSLAVNFVLTLMMVLKRMHLLIANEFDRTNRRKIA